MLDSKPALESLYDAWRDAQEREENAMRRAQQPGTSAATQQPSDGLLHEAERELAQAKDERMRLEELYWEERRLQEMPGYT